MSYPAFIDDIRRSRGLMTINQIQILLEQGNIIYDPFSVLISNSTKIGTGNIIYPCVSLLCHEQANLVIGNDNTFHSNTLIEATSGPVIIGTFNQFGEGGFTAKTNRPGAKITIGDNGRYLNGASVFGTTRLASGSQILGAVTVDSCVLEEGASFQEPDAQRRAGLLKGFGIARNMTVPMGHVIFGEGTFSANELKPQSFYHPKS